VLLRLVMRATIRHLRLVFNSLKNVPLLQTVNATSIGRARPPVDMTTPTADVAWTARRDAEYRHSLIHNRRARAVS